MSKTPKKNNRTALAKPTEAALPIQADVDIVLGLIQGARSRAIVGHTPRLEGRTGFFCLSDILVVDGTEKRLLANCPHQPTDHSGCPFPVPLCEAVHSAQGARSARDPSVAFRPPERHNSRRR